MFPTLKNPRPILGLKSLRDPIPFPLEFSSSPPPSTSSPGPLRPIKFEQADDDLRTCSKTSCRVKLPNHYRYKTCEKCREYGRAQTKKSKLLKQQQQYALPSFDDVIMEAEEENQPIEARFKSWMVKLREAGKIPFGSRANGAEDYVDGIDGKRKAGGDLGFSKKLKLDLSLGGDEEFQTQDDLCRALAGYIRRLTTVTSVGDFVGSYTVVVAESDEITEKVVRRAAKNTISQCKLPVCIDVPPEYKLRMRNGNMSCRTDYRCACSDDSQSEGNMCGGAITVDMRYTSSDLSDGMLRRIHGHKVIVKVIHDTD
ncbi:hypothetical protein EUX98_g1538 [Antrodiella citrinella]|uniref:Uncharacterized protein n=1 Tax=Antrodiella citrinella TaxID=2447956 RepID=A0A4S4N169_9APHY|nr:hypothetical protein EUX98_g1538 [Antrodiella citrinella]